jgi:hypothetical protein
LARSAAVLAVIGGAVVFLDRTAKQEHSAERRALQMRESELTSVASAPASTLSCLDETANETVERLCEKAIFATPEATAAAVSYVSGRLALLADEFAYTKLYDNTFETSVKAIGHAVELDRFGLYSHVLAARYRCAPESCRAFAFLPSRAQIAENLRTKKLERLIDRYAASWQSPGAATGTDASKQTRTRSTDLPSTTSIASVSIMTPEPAASWPSPGAARVADVPVSKGGRSRSIDFPSAASIPPVSIMTPEPAKRRPGSQ